jgi:molecular chaperone DnaK
MPAVGIDLGTTNSVVAAIVNGRPVVVPNSEGSRTTPSVVAFTGDGTALVGEAAKRQAITNPDRTVRSVKRRMGTRSTIEIDGHAYGAPEVSARTLQKLKRDAEDYLGDTVGQAVITVPAYFDDAQRTATKEAGEIAGLEVLRIINEPTAAALAYGFGRPEDVDRTVLVFDLGGGSFDVSVLEIGDGVFEVKATHGDTRLGGDDWDRRIIDWLGAQVRGSTDGAVDLSRDKMAMQRLKEAAELAKFELSGASEARIRLPSITTSDDGPVHLDETLTRSDFERVTFDLLDRCRLPVVQAIRDAGLRPQDVDEVVLVGGSTRMPAVADLVREVAGPPTRRFPPYAGGDESTVVAVGAAIQAGVLTGQVTDVLLLDVTPLSLGIETHGSLADGAPAELGALAEEARGGVMATLIDRNTTIPTRRSEVFTTAADMQESAEIHVLQGEWEMSSRNRSLGRFRLVGLPPAPRGVPQIEVTFDIDANGIVHVRAKDLATGKEQAMTITGRAALDREELDRVTRIAQQEADQDRRRRTAGDDEAEIDRHVFVSYSEEDAAYVEALVSFLRARDVRVWTDQSLVGGERWTATLRRAITECAAFVVVMSPAAESSIWVERELNLAEDEGRPVHPLLLQGGRWWRLSNIQYEDVTGGAMPRRAFVDGLRASIVGR